MTAPAPLDLTALLDDLERAHAAATRGAWEHVVDDHGPRKGVEHSVWDDVANRYIVETLAEAHAALIVAAVNAVPTLIALVRKRDAALRAVEALHVPSHSYCVVCDVERDVEVAGNNPRCEHRTSFCRACEIAWPCPTVRALTAALTPESVTT